ncbi:MAG: hypothetical protein ACK4GN_08940 [Runella sp.]
MKTFIITAALSVLTLGHIAEAQDGKSLRTRAQMTEELLASLPTNDDSMLQPTLVLTEENRQMIALLPTKDDADTKMAAQEAIVSINTLPTTKVENKENRRTER